MKGEVEEGGTKTNRYRAACWGKVFSSTDASGARAGGLLAALAAPRSIARKKNQAMSGSIRKGERAFGEQKDSPLPFTFPPNPPLPRRTTVDWFSKIFFPVALSTVSITTVTEAAFPYQSNETSRRTKETISLRVRRVEREESENEPCREPRAVEPEKREFHW